MEHLNNIVDRHSYFQLKYFVIGKEPTRQSMMWRCLKELQTRNESIETIKLEIDDIKDKIELLILDLNEKTDDDLRTKIKNRRKERDKKQLEGMLDKLYKKLKFIEEEAIFFKDQFNMMESKEKLLPYDDYKSQMEYWNAKLGEELQLKMLLRQPLDIELVKCIMSLGDEVPVKQETVKILTAIQQNQQKEIEEKK